MRTRECNAQYPSTLDNQTSSESNVKTYLIIPNLHGAIISPTEDVGLVTTGIVIDAVYTLLVALEGVVMGGTAQTPNLDGPIETGTGKGISVLGIELDLHNVMSVPLEDLGAVETAVPVPKLDGHVVRGRDDVGEGRVNLDATDVVGVRLELPHLLHGVVVVNPQPHVVGGGEEPLLPGDELGASDGQLRQLEGFDARARLIVPDHDDAGVEGGQCPWFRRVDVDGFYPFGRGRKLLLDVKAEWLRVVGGGVGEQVSDE